MEKVTDERVPGTVETVRYLVPRRLADRAGDRLVPARARVVTVATMTRDPIGPA